MPYYQKLVKEYRYLRSREDQLFFLTFAILVGVGFAGASPGIFAGILAKGLVVAGLILVCWAVLHFLRENANFKGEIANKIQEIEETQEISMIQTSNLVEFWKEDYYPHVLKLATLGGSLLVVLL